jgi:hypothetical protein
MPLIHFPKDEFVRRYKKKKRPTFH